MAYRCIDGEASSPVCEEGEWVGINAATLADIDPLQLKLQYNLSLFYQKGRAYAEFILRDEFLFIRK